MKKLILAIILTGFMAATIAQAADVVITTTIPDQHVARVSAAITGNLDCGALGPKACLKKELVRYIKNLVISYESSQIIGTANSQINALVEPEVN